MQSRQTAAGEHTDDQGVPVVTVRYFAAARQAAGTGREQVAAATVGSVLADAAARHGPDFARVMETCRVWVNGEEAGPTARLRPADEVALLPPVSGGSHPLPPATGRGPWRAGGAR